MRNTIIILTGYVSSGKSTLANYIEEQLTKIGNKVAKVSGDEYLKRNFPKEGFVFDKVTRIKLDEIISKDLISKPENNTFYIVDLGCIFEEGRQKYFSKNVKTVLIHVNTPLLVCMYREIVRSIKKDSPIKNWVYLKALKSKLLREKNKNLIQGITLPYEIPTDADITVDLSKVRIEDAYEEILKLL
jgi:adenylylsulfate kinase-like enzyme